MIFFLAKRVIGLFLVIICCDGRFLVSFAGKYLSLESCHAICHKISECGGSGVSSISSIEHEVFRINITQTDSEIFGPAFIEVCIL